MPAEQPSISLDSLLGRSCTLTTLAPRLRLVVNLKLVPSDIGFSRPHCGPVIKADASFRSHEALLAEPRRVESLASLVDDYVVADAACTVPRGVDRE